MAPDWDDMVLVGRIARPHGLRGEVAINPETDFVEERFRAGATLATRGPAGEATLTVATVRVVAGRPVVGFAGFADVEQAERLAGQELRVPEAALQPLEAGRFYHHQLAGCVVERVDGTPVGRVERVEGGSGASHLVVSGGGAEILVPLAEAICVDIDVEARRIRIDAPDGLLELNEVRRRHDLPADGRGRPRRGGGRPGD